MKIQGRCLIEDNFVLYKDTKLISIQNADISKNYEILYNNNIYKANIVNGNILFYVPEILDKNTILLNVYDKENRYLYSTNSLDLYPCIKKVVVVENEKINEELILDVQKLKTEFSQIKTEIKNLNNESDFNKIYNDLKNINQNFENIENKINNLNFNKEFKNIDDKIKQSNLDLLNKINTNNNSEQINNLIKSFNEIKQFYNKELDNLKFQISDINNNLLNTSKTIENKILEINNEESIKDINKNISVLKNDFNAFNFDNIFQNFNEEISNINKTFKDIKKEIKNLKDNEKKIILEIDNINLLNSKILEIENRIKNLDKKNENILLNINKKNKIDSYYFVTMYDGELIKYTYLANQNPIGITDGEENVIIKGIAKVRYAGNIHIGDFVYGNKNGIAENHNFGYIVVNIIDKEYCEVLL